MVQLLRSVKLNLCKKWLAFASHFSLIEVCVKGRKEV